MTIAAVLRSKGSEVETITAHATVGDAVAKLGQHRIGALPVVEGGAIAGIVSNGDLVKHRMERIEAEAEAMRTYIQTA